jgi:hypothetical protein
MFGGGAKHQHGNPIVLPIYSDVVKPFAHGVQTSQVVVLIQQLIYLRLLIGCSQLHMDLLQEPLQEMLLNFIGQSFCANHVRDYKIARGLSRAITYPSFDQRFPIHYALALGSELKPERRARPEKSQLALIGVILCLINQ